MDLSQSLSALLAIIGKNKPRVTELNAEARGAGVRPGMTAAQASATCPGLRLFPATAADADRSRATLLASSSREDLVARPAATDCAVKR